MRCKEIYITHFLTFMLGCSFAIFYLGNQVFREQTQDLSQFLPTKETFNLLIIVLSGVDNYARRKAARHSWGLMVSRSTQYVFVVGGLGVSQNSRTDLISEQEQYGDIVVLPIVDSYANLTLKLLETLRYVDSVYDYRFLLKIDDDSFINIEPLQKAVSFTTAKSMYWGYFSGTAHVFRRGKYKELNWFLCDRYLPYALGGGYLLSFDLVNYIVKNSHLFSLYLNEDVSVGTWLAPLNLTRFHDIRFDTAYKSRGCKNNYLILHKRTVAEIQKFGERISKGQNLCLEEIETMATYTYNWTTLPSSCCNHIK